MSDDEILKIEMLLHILGDCNTNLAKEEELIEMGKSFEQIIDCEIIDILYNLGFGNIVYDNKKGILNMKIIKD